MKRILCIALLVAVVMALSACTAEPIKVGGFSVAGSSDYVSDHGNPHISTTIDGHKVEGCDTFVMKRDSDFGVSLTWYEGISFDEYKEYLESDGLASEDGGPNWLPQSSQAWVTVEKRVSSQEDLTLKDGTQAYIFRIDTLTDLGEPYSYKYKEVVFPASEDSIGIIQFMAYSVEQWEVMDSLFGEVLDNLIPN